MATIGFIGGGMMAEAIIKGLLDKGLFSPENILVSEPVAERREYLSSTYKVHTVDQNEKVLKGCAKIILAVKPQVMKKVLEEIKEHIDIEKHLLITIAAGLPISFYEKILPRGTRLIRVMPNTCAIVHKSISALTKGSFATEEDLTSAEKLFSAIGETVVVGEELIDAVTALSGSGPAYVALFIESLIDGGVRAGLPRPLAEKLALATVVGSVEMMKKLKKNPYEIKAMVTSPAGTTITALEVFYQKGFPGTVIEAIYKAYLRSKELSEAFS
ncbi:pyrroline-5-carboxylate reductase [Thermodesulfobacterium thermophilum]|uniref:pyrroline-5-carboxylate reductase n=1 Tax=Thermodesulfobacterium thermophilum TaxID=886 RepID=UPI0003B33C1E|nr:pyrroline-5-carboxylate reductase [Thermodesulfobacterium thermophilum]